MIMCFYSYNTNAVWSKFSYLCCSQHKVNVTTIASIVVCANATTVGALGIRLCLRLILSNACVNQSHWEKSIRHATNIFYIFYCFLIEWTGRFVNESKTSFSIACTGKDKIFVPNNSCNRFSLYIYYTY